MAGGEGGFSVKAMGFDRKEVNDYIANLNQKMKEIEAEKKANDEKTQKALRMAQDADAKIKKAQEDGAKKIADLELQLKTERRNEENLLIQIDDLKRKLKNGGGGSAGGDKQADEIVAKANATAKSIVDKANATAKDTVEKAKATANKIIAQAQEVGGGSGGVDPAAMDEFMKVLSGFAEKMTSGFNELNQKASELLGAQSAAPITVPDFSDISAPQAETPKSAAPAKASKPAPSVSDDLFAMLEEDDAVEADNNEDDDDMVTEVRPLDDPSNAPGAVVLDEFDLSGSGLDLDLDTPVTEVKPINNKKQGKADLSDEFEKQILAQTANSAMLREELDEEMLAAVKQQEEHFAVKPSDDNVDDLSMDTSEDEDPLAAMLKQAELTFGGSGGNMSYDSEESEPEESSSASENSANPWAALQNELMAMEKSGDLGSTDIETDTSSAESASAVPNADDSAIWDFGSTEMSTGDDDDMGMSSDMFGNF